MKRTKKKQLTIPSYTFQATNDPNIQRFCDMNGDWTHYYLVKEKVFLPAVNHVLGIGYPKDKRFHEYLLNATKEEATKKLNEKGEAGARTHEAIRALLEGQRVNIGTKFINRQTGKREILSNDEWRNLQTWMTFAEKYSLQTLAIEYTLADAEIGMAGTSDHLGAITVPEGDKKLPKELWGKTVAVLPDWKTSSGIWDEYKAQVAIYLNIARKHPRLGKFFANNDVWTAIVRLGTSHKDGYEIEIMSPEETAHNFKLGMCAKTFYDNKTAGKKFEPEIVEIPAEFKLKTKLLALTKKVAPYVPRKPQISTTISPVDLGL